jgi:hypothetical protein
MAIESVVKAEDLGTFISPQDLSQILAPGLRRSSMIKSYFVDPEEERTNRIMDFAAQVANLFLEFYPDKIVTQVLIQFQRLLNDFLDDYGPNRYFTKLHIANHYLALLDYRLSLVGSKLSPCHIDYVRDLLGINKGKTFSYFSMKKVQSDLLAAGYLQRKRREVYSPLLKNKVSQIVNDLVLLFPKMEEELEQLQEQAFYLIDERIVPRINVDDAALVIVSSLLPYFIEDKIIMNTFWLIIEDKFNIELDFLRRKVYRFRSLLKKKNMNGLLGLGSEVEERCEIDECTSNNNKYV